VMEYIIGHRRGWSVIAVRGDLNSRRDPEIDAIRTVTPRSRLLARNARSSLLHVERRRRYAACTPFRRLWVSRGAKDIPLPVPAICHRAGPSSFASECARHLPLMLALALIYSRRA